MVRQKAVARESHLRLRASHGPPPPQTILPVDHPLSPRESLRSARAKLDPPDTRDGPPKRSQAVAAVACSVAQASHCPSTVRDCSCVRLTTPVSKTKSERHVEA